MPLLSDIVVIFLSSVIVLNPNGQFLDSVTITFNERYVFGVTAMCADVYQLYIFNILKMSESAELEGAMKLLQEFQDIGKVFQE
jgi:hypothetical protein